MAKKTRKVLRPTREWAGERERKRRFEWVTLDDGNEVCVWSGNIADALTVNSRAMRLGVFRELGEVDEGLAILWQIMLSCHDAEPPDGERVFKDDMDWAVQRLEVQEMNRIMHAIGRMNRTDVESANALKDFMQRSEDAPLPPSSTGASKSSESSPASS